ncbi:unnamed protein product [Urochloa decumbens]|uniref:AAA+ ATPase domain-containing protein n=1 Tax=Urochloa decumbens TaxID=240449 RepID=A0ABC9B9I9_9POAL
MEVVLDWRSVGSLIATVMLFRTAVRDVLPPEVELYLRRLLTRIATAFWGAQGTVLIDEVVDGSIGGSNDLYDAAQLYLGARCLAAAPTVRLHKSRQAQHPTATLPDLHTIYDTFDAVHVRWTTTERGGSGEAAFFNPYNVVYGRGGNSKQRSLELQFPRQHRDLIHNRYIPHLVDEATKMRLKSRERRLYTNRAAAAFGFGGEEYHQMWTSHGFSHPSTFDTLALDPALREEIRADLLRFVSRREYYAHAGRAWKRGYLLHGPPGTGKTSLVAAIANLLEFDVYDLELTTVSTNSHLRRLLVSTTPKSVVVIEDIDCSLDLTRRGGANATDNKQDGGVAAQESISLSGVLNFLDGLWSSCIGERLMVLTTNHPERLDPVLLRPGRMDRKIELGYCSPAALRVLANNYLDVGREDADAQTTVQKLIAEAEQLLATEVHITPADIAEVFMGCDGAGATAALTKLVDELQRRRGVATAMAD